MKVLIWLVCILVYSAAVSALNLAGVGLGGIPVVLLSILLIFLPAPALCRLLGPPPAAAPGCRCGSAGARAGAAPLPG